MEKTNKLIAEFMGFPTHTDAVDDRTIAYYVGESIMHTDNTENDNDYDVFHPDDMQFHTSWDWIIPVVDKIKILVMEDDSDKLYNSEEWDNITHTLVQIEIKSVYKAVVEFIKNQNN
jgi:hypothetical protein